MPYSGTSLRLQVTLLGILFTELISEVASGDSLWSR